MTAGGQTLLEYAHDAAGRVYSLTQQVARPDNPADPNTTVSVAPVTWSVGYDGLRSFSYDAEGRLSAVTMGATDTSPTTRYVHNALGSASSRPSRYTHPAEGDESDQGSGSRAYDPSRRRPRRSFFVPIENPRIDGKAVKPV